MFLIAFEGFRFFFNFVNFYRCFIEAFSQIAAGFLDMLKGDTKEKFKDIKFVFTSKTLKLFNELKYFFTYAFMLIYYNLMHRIMLEYNVFQFVILAILLQLI